MTPNDKLPEETYNKVLGDAVVYDKERKMQVAYYDGATAWAGWKARFDELKATIDDKIDKALHAERNKMQATVTKMDMDWLQRAQGLADTLEWIRVYGNVGELTIKFIDKALQQFKDWEGEKDEQYVKATDTVTITMTNMNPPLAKKMAVWVKASEPPTHERYIPIRFADGTYKVAAFTTDHMLKERQPYWMYSRHDPINTLLEFEWYNDESGTAAGREEDAVSKEVIDFIRDIAENWDCDEDGHKYNTGCRKCSASELYYELSKQQKEK